jgi:hypothetical protein
MATTSRYAFGLDLLRSKLELEPTFDVRRVFILEQVGSATKTEVYVNIISDDVETSQTESSYIHAPLRRMTIGIYAIAKNGLDSMNEGLGAINHGIIVEKIDKCIDAVAAELPTSETTAAGYDILIHSIDTSSVTGYVDDKGDNMAIMYEVVLTYVQS